MSRRVDKRFKNNINYYKFYSTISDQYTSDWLTRNQAILYLAQNAETDYKLKVIQEFMAFPEKFYTTDDELLVNSRERTSLYYEWNLKLLNSDNYYEALDKKFNEIMEQLK